MPRIVYEMLSRYILERAICYHETKKCCGYTKSITFILNTKNVNSASDILIWHFAKQ